jgi:hypothetical protein
MAVQLYYRSWISDELLSDNTKTQPPLYMSIH